MSDSMSKTEIEDVLSSIRRLVTEDHRPQQRPYAPSADKLVLTPALRIGPAPAAVTQTFGAAEPLRLVAAPPLDPAGPASHQAAAALEAALRGHRDDWEPDGTEAAPSPNWSVEWDAATAADPDSQNPESPDVAAAQAADSPLASGAGPAALAGHSDAEEDIWDDFLAEHRSAPLLAAEQAEHWRPAERGFAGLPGSEDESEGTPQQRPDVIALTAAVQPVPQAAPAVEDEDEKESSPRAAVLPEDLQEDLPEGRLEDGLSALSGSDSPPDIDELMLRDLIRDVLREELQGELGERITRNVRKLVRAELARALTARDLT